MKFELTKHASEVISERNISEEYLERAIDNPGLKMDDREDPALEHLLAKIMENDNRVLRVIVIKNSDPVRVITAFFDRSMRGKL